MKVMVQFEGERTERPVRFVRAALIDWRTPEIVSKQVADWSGPLYVWIGLDRTTERKKNEISLC